MIFSNDWCYPCVKVSRFRDPPMMLSRASWTMLYSVFLLYSSVLHVSLYEEEFDEPSNVTGSTIGIGIVASTWLHRLAPHLHSHAPRMERSHWSMPGQWRFMCMLYDACIPETAWVSSESASEACFHGGWEVNIIKTSPWYCRDLRT